MTQVGRHGHAGQSLAAALVVGDEDIIGRAPWRKQEGDAELADSDTRRPSVRGNIYDMAGAQQHVVRGALVGAPDEYHARAVVGIYTRHVNENLLR